MKCEGSPPISLRSEFEDPHTPELARHAPAGAPPQRSDFRIFSPPAAWLYDLLDRCLTTNVSEYIYSIRLFVRTAEFLFKILVLFAQSFNFISNFGHVLFHTVSDYMTKMHNSPTVSVCSSFNITSVISRVDLFRSVAKERSFARSCLRSSSRAATELFAWSSSCNQERFGIRQHKHGIRYSLLA